MPNYPTALVDLPVFELCNQPPVLSSALSAMCTAESGDDRYVYYLVGSAFFRHDTVADTWQTLNGPITAPLTVVSMRYTAYRGFHGRVISAGAGSVRIPGLRLGSLDQAKIRIISGTGAGQEKTLTFVNENVHDAGVLTAIAANTLTDTTKRWIPNQWAGYQLSINYGTLAPVNKTILYNDTNTLYLGDANLQPHFPFNAQGFAAAGLYALPVATAGLQAHYQIMSSDFTIDGSWTTNPDSTSQFTTLTGGIYLVSSAAAAPFFTLQYYDVIADQWQIKTVPQSLLSAALGTDISVERTGRVGGALITSQATGAGTARTLVNSGAGMTPDAYRNHRVFITGGTGAGQNRRIVANSGTVLTVGRSFDIVPDATSTYQIWPDPDRLYLMGGAASAMFAYSAMSDWWMQGQEFDWGITCNISATLNGQMPVGVATGVRIAAGVQAINATPTAGGTGYLVGDVLTCAVGGTGAQVIVTSVAPGGVVTGLALFHSGTGTGYTVGTGRATTGGAGTGCTIEITAAGPTALITTATSHWYKTGDSIVFAGCNDAAWNAAHIIIAVNALPAAGVLAFSVIPTAAANMAATASQSTTTIVDPTANWITNEHVGRLVHVCVAGVAPTSQIRWITANTMNTLTLSSAITAAVNGTSKYAIYDAKPFGVDNMRKEDGKQGYGRATGGSTTTLVDSTKSWIPNQWAGFMFKVEAGAGYGSGRISIISNTENTLTYAVQGFTPDATSRYEIADSWGLATAGTTTSITEATTKNWPVNQFAGKRVRIMSGAGVGQEAAITSNTATALTTGTIVAPGADSAYAILGIPPRSTGIELCWTWGAFNAQGKRSMYCPRGGGSPVLDRYDIATERWTYGFTIAPEGEGFTSGSSYAYDGADTIYMSRSVVAQNIRVMAYNTRTNKVSGKLQTPWVQGTVTIGNFMEIAKDSVNGYQFLYVMQNTGSLFSRALLMPN